MVPALSTAVCSLGEVHDAIPGFPAPRLDVDIIQPSSGIGSMRKKQRHVAGRMYSDEHISVISENHIVPVIVQRPAHRTAVQTRTSRAALSAAMTASAIGAALCGAQCTRTPSNVPARPTSIPVEPHFVVLEDARDTSASADGGTTAVWYELPRTSKSGVVTAIEARLTARGWRVVRDRADDAEEWSDITPADETKQTLLYVRHWTNDTDDLLTVSVICVEGIPAERCPISVHLEHFEAASEQARRFLRYCRQKYGDG